MRWQGRRQSDQVEDRRGVSGGKVAGGGIGVIVVALILFDLLGHVRKAHEPTLKEAGIWSLIYIGFSIIFGGILYLRHGATFAGEYFAGFLTEKALSLDNIFVFIIIICNSSATN